MSDSTTDVRNEAITIDWLFGAVQAYIFTLPQLESLVDGLNSRQLELAFHDQHVDGGAFAEWFTRQASPPCTLRLDFLAFIRDKVARTGKTVATLPDPRLFVFCVIKEYWDLPRRTEREQKQKEAAAKLRLTWKFSPGMRTRGPATWRSWPA